MTNTIYTLFQSVAEHHKNQAAIIENERTMTFGELSDLVDRIAGSFPKAITSVGIVMNHRAEMIASMLAVLKMCIRDRRLSASVPHGRHFL